MLSEIMIGGFKSFGEPVSFDLAPLTIFVGPNGVGKSSVFEAVGLMAQSSASGGLVWTGRWVDFPGGLNSVKHRGSAGGLVFGAGLSAEGTTSSVAWDHDSGKASFYFSGRSKAFKVDGEEIAVATRQQGDAARVIYYGPRDADGVKHEIANYNASFGDSFPDASVLEIGQGDRRPPIKEIADRVSNTLGRLLSFLRDDVYLIGAHRLPVRISPTVQLAPYAVGKDGSNTLAALSLALRNGDEIAKKIVFWAKEFGMPEIQSGWVNQPTLLADYRDPASGEKIESGMAGFGSQQILPVITQLFCARPGGLVLIEEPEISLHPEAQVSLLRMLADAVSSGRQVMITTHSQTLLSALGELSSDGRLKPSDIAIYHLSKTAAGTAAERLEIDPAWYIRGWVPSFSKVETRLLRDWIHNVGDRIEADA